MTRIMVRLGAAMAACLIGFPAIAQTGLEGFLEDGDYTTELDRYVGTADNGDLDYETLFDSGNVANLSLALEHLTPTALNSQFNITPTDTFDVASISKVMGVVVGAYGSNFAIDGFVPDGNLNVFIPCLSNDPSNALAAADEADSLSEGGLYGVEFERGSYTQAYNAYANWLSGGTSQPTAYGNRQVTAAQFRQELFGCSVRGAGVNPIVGNPDSVQFQQVADGLDFTQPQIGPDDSAWGLGGRIGRIEYGGRTGTQASIRLNRNYRFAKGSRAFLSIDTPITYQNVDGQTQWRGYLAASVVVPTSTRLTISPRVSFGYAEATDEHVRGLVAAGTVSALYAMPNLVGRGTLTAGGMVGYSKVVRVEFAGRKLDAQNANVTWRGGLSYDLPLNHRFMGRGGSARVSYAFTHVGGDPVFVQNVHELTASVGVRSRETTARNAFELLRIGMIARLAHDSNAAHLFVGYRF